MAKNPNQNRGIIVTVTKRSGVNLSLPCARLSRRLTELLEKAKVRSTEYSFVIHENPATIETPFKAIKLLPQIGSTLEFMVFVKLPNGECFFGKLKAPVKCGGDGFDKELFRAAAEIETSGWFEAENEKATPDKKPVVATSPNQALIRNMQEMVSKLNIEIVGLDRDIDRLRNKKTALEEVRKQMLGSIQSLKTAAIASKQS